MRADQRRRRADPGSLDRGVADHHHELPRQRVCDRHRRGAHRAHLHRRSPSSPWSRPTAALYPLHSRAGGSADNIDQTYNVNLSSEQRATGPGGCESRTPPAATSAASTPGPSTSSHYPRPQSRRSAQAEAGGGRNRLFSRISGLTGRPSWPPDCAEKIRVMAIAAKVAGDYEARLGRQVLGVTPVGSSRGRVGVIGLSVAELRALRTGAPSVARVRALTILTTGSQPRSGADSAAHGAKLGQPPLNV